MNFFSQVKIVISGFNLETLVLIKTRIPNYHWGIILNSLDYEVYELREGDGDFDGI